MVTFTKQCAQGDLLMTKIDVMPKNVTKDLNNDDDYTVAHSETGHNHVMSAKNTDFYIAANDPFVIYADVKKVTELRHLRSFDTHKTITVNPGLYRINRQREYIAEGFRRAQD